MIKTVRQKNYNYNFNTENGFFMRWGKTFNEDPEYSPIGPEIADIEVSTICSGPFGTPCPWCYKSNNQDGTNMTLDTFISVVENINMYKNLTQIAFGVGDIDANPDLIYMFRWCRENGIVPNITVNGARLANKFENKTYYQHITDLCGAVAVSHYDDDLCFDAVNTFTDLGMKQVNIHKILAEETLDDCLELLKKVQTDKRLKNLNAVIFLLLKPKGKRNTLTPVKSKDKYKQLIEYAINNNIPFGFDSCGANKFLEAVKGMKNYKQYKIMAEPCESAMFSIYVNVEGKAFPCSFGEGIGEWREGIDIINCNNFIKDIWFGERFKQFREKCILNNRNCIFYNL